MSPAFLNKFTPLGRRVRLVRAARLAYKRWEDAFYAAVECNCAIVYDDKAAQLAKRRSMVLCRRYAAIESALPHEAELPIETVHSCITQGIAGNTTLFADVSAGMPLVQSMYPEASVEVQESVALLFSPPSVPSTIFGSGARYWDRESEARWQREQRFAA
jgi:hypothetical protein